MKISSILVLVFAGTLITLVSLVRQTVGEAAPRRVDITARRFTYEPDEITLKKGEPVVLAFKSADVPHGIRFAALNLDTKIGKGAPGKLSFTPTKTGDFDGRSSVFCGAGHGSMMMTIHVVE